MEQLSLRLVVRCLETTEQFVKRLKHLAGKLRGDDVLILAAAFEDGRKTFSLGDTVEALE